MQENIPLNKHIKATSLILNSITVVDVQYPETDPIFCK